ncbi:MAG TPA: TrkA family potassium uptake protein [Anaerolineales bacterium]|nr:TrkA family potassium uptake protein [Anaerolineales bacterium]
MKVIVMGCGRVGEQLSQLLLSEGHQVTVIDKNSQALGRLGSNFKGRVVQGVGFDREVLVASGIEEADAFAATSSSDNVNILSARIARNYFQVPRVVARLYDPRRAEIYQRLGLLTISSTTWGAERIRELLTHSELDPILTFGSGEVCLLSLEAPYPLIGKMIKIITIPGEVQIISITRKGHAFMPLIGAEVHRGDILHLEVLASAMGQFKELLGLEEGSEG